MTPAVANDVSPAYWQVWRLTHQISGAGLKMMQTTFVTTIYKGGVLPTQAQVHKYRCCKRPFSCPLAKGESYQPTLLCMSEDVAKECSPVQ